MKTTSHPAPEVTGSSFHRIAMIAVAAAALVSIFVGLGAPSPDELTKVAHAAPAAQRLHDDVAGGSAPVPSESTAAMPQWPDMAVLEHERLDPVGSGRNPRP